jgi:hypothetical protein
MARAFNEDQIELTLGDKIDYDNDRLGDLIQLEDNIAIFITDHLEFVFTIPTVNLMLKTTLAVIVMFILLIFLSYVCLTSLIFKVI